MARITFNNKTTLNPQPSIARENKVIDDDINEIKSVVNANAGVCDYSTSETDTGKTFVDGKKIYRRVFFVPTLPNTDTLTTSYSISGVDWVTAVYGSARNKTNHNSVFPINVTRPINNASAIGAYFDTYLKIETYSDRSGFEAYVVVEYTKSS